MKKVIALILTVALILTFAVASSASTIYPSKTGSSGVEGLTWDAENGAWVLEDATIDLTEDERINFSEDVTIVVKGTNVINVGGYGAFEGYSITVKGDGKLSILTTANNSVEDYCGICADEVIIDGPTIIMDVPNADNIFVKAIHAASGKLEVKSGNLEISVPEGNTESYAVKVSQFVVSGDYLSTYVKVGKCNVSPVDANGDPLTMCDNNDGNVAFPYVEGGIEYPVTAPEDSNYVKGAGKDFTFKSAASISKYEKTVLVDENGAEIVVPDTGCTVVSGSTEVTMKATYLDTLPAGKYTAEIVSVDGKATTTIVIKEAAIVDTDDAKEEVKETIKEEVANTADNTVIGMFVALGTLSAAGFVSLKKKEN